MSIPLLTKPNNFVDIYVNLTNNWLKSSNFTPEYNVTEVSIPVIVASIFISGSSVLLGILLLIILSMMASAPEGPQLRPGSRRLLKWLTVADVFRAMINGIGQIRYLYRYAGSSKAMSDNECNADIFCLILAFLREWSNLAVNFWTLAIGIYFVFKSLRHHRRIRGSRMDAISTTLHCLCWGLPLMPTTFAFTFGALGENFSPFTGTGTCGVTSCSCHKGETLLWITATSKVWEIIIFTAIFSIYVWSKLDILLYKRRLRRQPTCAGSSEIVRSTRRHNLRYVLHYNQVTDESNSVAKYGSVGQTSSCTQILSVSSLEDDTHPSSFPTISPPSSQNSRIRRRSRNTKTQEENKSSYISQIQEENFFYLLIIFLYLGKCWNIFRFFLSCGVYFSAPASITVVKNLSFILLCFQSLGDTSQATLNFIVFIIHCDQGRRMFVSRVLCREYIPYTELNSSVFSQ